MARNPQMTDAECEELASLVREWRGDSGMEPAQAAEILGIPQEIYEGIEQGRGFAYPALLVLALIAVRQTSRSHFEEVEQD